MTWRAWWWVTAAVVVSLGASLPAAAQDAGGGDGGLAAARALLWSGRLAEAERGFERLILRDGRKVDALLGVAQARRWSGRPLAAREPAARAVALAPERGDAREELAWTYADAGRAAGARAAFAGALAAPSPALRARLHELSSAAVTLSNVAYEDSNGAVRLASRASVEIPFQDARLRLVAGGTRVAVASETLDRAVGGASLAIPFGPVELRGRWAAHGSGGEPPLHEAQLGGRIFLSDALRLGLSVARRPFVETEGLSTDEAAYHGAGPGGALDPAFVSRLEVREARGSAAAAPFRATYLYADARGFTVSDANRGWAVAAGTGVNVLGALGVAGPLDVVLRWDAYFTGFDEPRTAYFSPPFLDGHSPGVELRVRPARAVELVAEAGFTRSLSSDPGPGGWFGGGAVTVRTGRFTLAGRAQARNDPWYASRRAFLSLSGRL